MQQGVKALVIGDPHFKHGPSVIECEEYIRKIAAIARKCKPTFIVILGDILDRHEVVHVQAHKLASTLLEMLSLVAHTYVIMGNHDYINNSQFLTDNHIFGPFKRWKNITIVDTVIGTYINERYFVFVPYVPPGRFIEALETLIKEGETWELADCIFAHQEFKGCKPRMHDNDFKSKVGDVWNEDYPLVISGHIHKAQNVGKNIKYPGNSLQHSHLENGNKSVWIIEWPAVDLDDSENSEPKITKISTGMKKKKSDAMTIEELKEKDDEYFEEQAKFDLLIKLIGTSAEFNNFKTSKLHEKLQAQGVSFSYELDTNADITSIPTYAHRNNTNDTNDTNDASHTDKGSVCYDRVFQNLVANKNDLIRREYEELFGKLENNKGVEGEDYIEITFATDSDES